MKKAKNLLVISDLHASKELELAIKELNDCGVIHQIYKLFVKLVTCKRQNKKNKRKE